MSSEMDDRLRDLAEDYHRPPPTPRDAMWEEIRARIERDRAAAAAADATVVPIERGRRAFRPRTLSWVGLGGAAAMLALGFGLGRMTGPATGPADSSNGVAQPAAFEGALVRTAAAEHLVRSEELLSVVRADAQAGRVDPGVGTWGRGLLLETRMLLGSPAATDPEMRALLEDLELILAQIALLAEEDPVEGKGPEELRLIAQGIETQAVLPRIHAVLPAVAGPRTEE